MIWRAWLAVVMAGGALGSALVLACSGDWRAAGLAVVVALPAAALWVCGELASTKALMCGDGRHRRRRGTLDAAMAALRAVARVPLP